jgi:hypothetical protein
MDAVGDRRERRFSDVQKVNPLGPISSAIALGDVRRNRVRSFSELRTELEPLLPLLSLPPR